MDRSQFREGAMEREYMLRTNFDIKKRPDGVSAEEQRKRNRIEAEKRDADTQRIVKAIQQYVDNLGELSRQVATGEVAIEYKNKPTIKVRRDFKMLKNGETEVGVAGIERVLLKTLVEAKKTGDARVHVDHARFAVENRSGNNSKYAVDRETITNARKRLNNKIKDLYGIERAIMIKGDHMWLEVRCEVVNW